MRPDEAVVRSVMLAFSLPSWFWRQNLEVIGDR